METPTDLNSPQVKQYVNVKDKFSNTPLLICCIQDLMAEQGSAKENQRLQCMQILAFYGADINVKNESTQWSAIHW